MQFNYKIKIELNSTFEAPLLGADTTGFRRGMIDKILAKEVKQMVSKGIPTKEISDDNMKIEITVSKVMRGVMRDTNGKIIE
jgi:hypothetical protein